MKKLFKRFFLPTALFLTTLLGCQKDMLESSKHGQSKLTIKEAREYFESNFKPQTSTNSRENGEGQETKQVKWEKAYNKAISIGDAVAVPMDLKNGKWRASNGDYLPFSDVNYLLMYKNKNDINKIHTEWVSLLPDMSWLKGNRDRFTGKIIIQTFEGSITRVIVYAPDGKITEKEIVGPGKIAKSNTRTSVDYSICITVKDPQGPTAVGTPDAGSTHGTGGGGGGKYATYCWGYNTPVTDPWGGETGTGGSGGTGSENGLLGHYTGSMNGGGGGATGGDYVPLCNPNIPPGTPVNSNQLQPCGTGFQLVSGSGIDFDHEVSDEQNIFFEEGDPEAMWWDIESVPWQQQVLPSYASFYSAYPKDPQDPAKDMINSAVYNLIGGRVKELYDSDNVSYGNACALRVSRGLNYSGVTIPYIASHTVQGGDGKFYFMSAAKLYSWMKKVFPSNQKVLYNADGGRGGWDFNAKLKPDKGIYIMRPNFPGAQIPARDGQPARPGFGASGHCALYNGNACIGKCYFNIDGGVNQLTLWILN